MVAFGLLRVDIDEDGIRGGSTSTTVRVGLFYVCDTINLAKTTAKNSYALFRKYYGCSPVDASTLWHDLVMILDDKDCGQKGFFRFMMAQHYLWTYPKNAQLLANTFKVCQKYARGAYLWDMIKAIAKLLDKKIEWDPDFDKDDTEVFIMTVDGTDFRIWEPKHDTLPYDKGYWSHKHNHAALRYEIGISLKFSKVVWVNGPHRGGKSDLQICKEKLLARIRKGKKVIVDGTYQGDPKLAKPDCLESKRLKNFKSRGRLRHESFNGRLKKFATLNQTFEHGIEKHKYAFEAICVICQNSMDNGSELFEI